MNNRNVEEERKKKKKEKKNNNGQMIDGKASYLGVEDLEQTKEYNL